jgi:16S rRNA (adenine1518-N6/adenine1519-N6)-dimethyltransferase
VPHSPLASPSATLSLLQQHGLWTRTSLGQHFLVDDNVVGRILDLAALSGDEIAIEVGAGIGTLTIPLCDAAASVVAVEADTALLPVLAQTTGDCPRLEVLCSDVLDLSPEALSMPFGPPDALVSNLPYGVAATVILGFFEQMPTVKTATVMVQAEVADRIVAAPGTKEYGAYTVKLRLRATVSGRFGVSRASFLPPPRVDSSVIRLERSTADVGGHALERAARLADAAFAQRRKTIRNSLAAVLPETPEAIDAGLRAADIDGALRAETLPPERFIALAQAMPVGEG